MNSNAIRIGCNPVSSASIMRITRNAPKRRLFMSDEPMLHELLSPRTEFSWFGQRAFNWPSIIKSHADSAALDAKQVRPFCHSFRFVTKGDKSICASVSSLFLFGRPTAISRLVVTIVVDTINAMFRSWRQTHIGKKVVEAFKPTRTYRNPARFIPLGIGASISHSFPRTASAAMSCRTVTHTFIFAQYERKIKV